jgi:hypothetical protein
LPTYRDHEDFVEGMLQFGDETIRAAKPGRQLAFLSHDDRLEIRRGFSGGLLVRQLTGLGYWRHAVR